MQKKTQVNTLQTFYPHGVKRLVVYSFTSHQKQESHAVAENYRAMRHAGHLYRKLAPSPRATQ